MSSATTSEKRPSSLSKENAYPRAISPVFTLRNSILSKLRGQLGKVLLENKSLSWSPSAIVPVYDILNCGPRHRFATAGLIVHNCLALGYGAGWKKFITMALQPMYGNLDLCAEDNDVAMQLSLDKKFYVEEKVVENGKDIFLTKEYDAAKHGANDKALRKRFVVVKDPHTGLAVRENVYGVNARVIVAHFRKNNPLIGGEAGIWKQLDNLLKTSAAKGEDCVVEIAGRSMTWRNCRLEKRRKTDKETGETYTKTEVRYDQGWKTESTYGGKATENVCQWFARHVFMHCLRRAVVEGGADCPLDVYDEAMLEVDDDGTSLFVEQGGYTERFKLEAPDDKTALGRMMRYFASAPPWADGLPVACEGVWSDKYLK